MNRIEPLVPTNLRDLEERLSPWSLLLHLRGSSDFQSRRFLLT